MIFNLISVNICLVNLNGAMIHMYAVQLFYCVGIFLLCIVCIIVLCSYVVSYCCIAVYVYVYNLSLWQGGTAVTNCQ